MLIFLVNSVNHALIKSVNLTVISHQFSHQDIYLISRDPGSPPAYGGRIRSLDFPLVEPLKHAVPSVPLHLFLSISLH